MAIFNSYVSSPEGITFFQQVKMLSPDSIGISSISRHGRMGLQSKESQTDQLSGAPDQPFCKEQRDTSCGRISFMRLPFIIESYEIIRVIQTCENYHGALNGIPVLAIGCGHFCIWHIAHAGAAVWQLHAAQNAGQSGRRCRCLQTC